MFHCSDKYDSNTNGILHIFKLYSTYYCYMVLMLNTFVFVGLFKGVCKLFDMPTIPGALTSTLKSILYYMD
jgi:hypothetical protein